MLRLFLQIIEQLKQVAKRKIHQKHHQSDDEGSNGNNDSTILQLTKSRP